MDEYFKCIFSEHLPVINSEEIDEEGQKFEFIMLALRTAEGLDACGYKKLFKTDFFEEHKKALEKVARYLDIDGDSVRIKDEYLFVQNSIIIEFLES